MTPGGDQVFNPLLTSFLAWRLSFLWCAISVFSRKVLLKLYLLEVIHFHLLVPLPGSLENTKKLKSASCWCWIIFRYSWNTSQSSSICLSPEVLPLPRGSDLNRAALFIPVCHLQGEKGWMWGREEKTGASFNLIPRSSAINNMCHSWGH